MSTTSLTLLCGQRRLSLSVPRVMGIVNITPDSFYAGSRHTSACDVLETVEQMVLDGVDVVDLGAYSTRPGATEVSEQEERQRLETAFGAIHRNFPQLILSVDTFRSGIVRYLYEHYGPFMVNDVTAGAADEQMVPLVAELDLPYVAMHMRGTPATMQQLTDYDDVLEDVLAYLRKRLTEFRVAGVRQVILDPGFGFAKTLEQNYHLFNHLEAFQTLGVPLLVGISRKGMIWKPLAIDPARALPATSALHLQALLHGASILRVHDVAEAMQMIRLMKLLKTC